MTDENTIEQRLRTTYAVVASELRDEAWPIPEPSDSRSKRPRQRVRVGVAVTLAIVGVAALIAVVRAASGSAPHRVEVNANESTPTAVTARPVSFGVFQQPATATDVLPQQYQHALETKGSIAAARRVFASGRWATFLVKQSDGNYCVIVDEAVTATEGGGGTFSCGEKPDGFAQRVGVTATPLSDGSLFVSGVVPDFIVRVTSDGRELAVTRNGFGATVRAGSTLRFWTADGEQLPPVEPGKPVTRPAP